MVHSVELLLTSIEKCRKYHKIH